MPIDHFGLGVPDVDAGAQVFLYPMLEDGDFSRHRTELFPEYNAHFYATFFLDMHGFMLEAVTYENVEDADA